MSAKFIAYFPNSFHIQLPYWNGFKNTFHSFQKEYCHGKLKKQNTILQVSE